MAAAGHDLTYLALSGVLAHVGRADQAPPTAQPGGRLRRRRDAVGAGGAGRAGRAGNLRRRPGGRRGHGRRCRPADGAAVPGPGRQVSGRRTVAPTCSTPAHRSTTATGADGGWLAVAAIEAQFSALLDGLGLADEDLPDQHDRSGWPVLRSRFAAVIAGRDRDDWAARFEGIDACVAPVLDMGEAPLVHPRQGATGVRRCRRGPNWSRLALLPHPAAEPQARALAPTRRRAPAWGVPRRTSKRPGRRRRRHLIGNRGRSGEQGTPTRRCCADGPCRSSPGRCRGMMVRTTRRRGGTPRCRRRSPRTATTR